jgi:hypothetical protein
VGVDEAYDTREHEDKLRAMNVSTHVAQNDHVHQTGGHPRSAVDGGATRHAGCALAQKCRKAIEFICDWSKLHSKLHSTMLKMKHRGFERLAGDSMLYLTCHNLVRLP